jgi:transcriptional regulator with XRE-family HTH domain
VRQELSEALREARRAASLTQTEVTKRLGWAGSRISLIGRARLKVSQADAGALLDIYNVRGQARTELPQLVEEASEGRGSGCVRLADVARVPEDDGDHA